VPTPLREIDVRSGYGLLISVQAMIAELVPTLASLSDIWLGLGSRPETGDAKAVQMVPVPGHYHVSGPPLSAWPVNALGSAQLYGGPEVSTCQV
jgi:hypothetical protein